MIPNTDAIIYPWAMMIHSINAAVAHFAVTSSSCFYYLADWAKILRVNQLH